MAYDSPVTVTTNNETEIEVERVVQVTSSSGKLLRVVSSGEITFTDQASVFVFLFPSSLSLCRRPAFPFKRLKVFKTPQTSSERFSFTYV